VLAQSNHDLISTNLPLFMFLPFQGGGQEGDGLALAPDSPHPHPNPPLEGEGVFQRKTGANQESRWINALDGAREMLYTGQPLKRIKEGLPCLHYLMQFPSVE
jgi:hypothetical protein